MIVRDKDKVQPFSQKRIMILFTLSMLAICLLVFRLAWIQVVKADEYSDIAINQQKGDVQIEAKRGFIYDRNGKELAASATSYNVWIMPEAINENYKGPHKNDLAEKMAAILGKPKEDILELFDSKEHLVKLAAYQDKEVVEKLQKLDVLGLSVASTTRRFYPMGNFASHLLGSVNEDNVGRSGIELEYDQYLSGVSGRWIRSADINGNALSFGSEKYYGAEDGLNVVTTIDEVLQHYLENAIKVGYEKTEATKITAIVMDPKTGEVLAMANAPSFDPNYPMEPLKDDKDAFKKMNAEERTDYLSKLWRNPSINDVNEPGSTFKLLTTSIALEEGVANPETLFTCRGHETIDGVELYCWNKNVHGTVSVKRAVAESCNTVQMQLGRAIGPQKFFEYMDLYGITRPTGIDYPAEAYPYLQDRSTAGNVEMSTMYFGQGFSTTPIQLVTAISAIGNDGKLMKPRLVKKLTDKDGKTVKEFEPEVVRKVISKSTADEMLGIMEYQVTDGGGKIARIPGYRIGGKTGTSEVVKDGKYTGDTYASFVAMAPIEDPKLCILVTVDSPKSSRYGVTAAAPIVKEFLSKSLPYLGVQAKIDEKQ